MGKTKRKRQRGIFAIEGEWFSDLRGGVSFRPVLEVMRSLNRSPFVHRDAATREEFFYYLSKWVQKRYSRYPILYLGYHGDEESIIIGDARESDCRITLDELLNGSPRRSLRQKNYLHWQLQHNANRRTTIADVC